MDKALKSIWVRAFAPVLCTISSIVLIVSVLATVFFAEMGGTEDIYDNVYQEIADGYAMYAVDEIAAGNTQSLGSYLSKRGISCSVMRQDVNSGAFIQEFNCGEIREDNLYQREIGADTNRQYTTSSLFAVLFGYNYTASDWAVHSPVEGYVFDKEAGLFYYETEKYFFNVESIIVYQGGSYIDYTFTKKDGEECYYNAYYDIQLDTTQYMNWDYVGIHDMKMQLVDDDRFLNTIHIKTTTDINLKGIGGIVVDANSSYVEHYPKDNVDTYVVQIDWDEEKSDEQSLFLEWEYLYHDIMQFENYVIINIIFSFLLFIIGFVLLVYSANNEKEKLGVLHKAPIAIYTGILFLAEFGLLALLVQGLPEILIDYGRNSVDIGIVLASIIAIVMAGLAFIWLQNIITRFKCRSFWRTTEVYYAYKLVKLSWGYLTKPVKWCWEKLTTPFRFLLGMCKQGIQMAEKNTPLFWGGLILFGLLSFIDFYTGIHGWWYEGVWLLLFLFIKVVEAVALIIILGHMQQLHEASKRVASGDMSQPIDTSRMFWKFKEHGENINKVSEGIALAVEERMKSEHFKTELITNVSHDIKTPLTSIINYVDLIKKEEIADEKLQEYIDVLDRQSARLKKLIEDLMEASKASTGNLAVNLEECDVEVLLTQVIGEFEEKLQKNQLQVIVEKPDQPVKMMADGRHIWRVLDNLLNNACKYSLPGSRVYISLKLENRDVVIIFKNISKEALNIPSDELMERFVRGDSSRNTEGSGLGLSIAQSLTELMNGTMKLEIDGDLFKVTLRFPILVN